MKYRRWGKMSRGKLINVYKIVAGVLQKFET
jgi:hypothetical protein